MGEKNVDRSAQGRGREDEKRGRERVGTWTEVRNVDGSVQGRGRERMGACRNKDGASPVPTIHEPCEPFLHV